MPTNRPFLSNFLSAFRAHSAIQSKTTATSQTAHPHTPASVTNPRTIATSSKNPTAHSTTAALSSLHSPRSHSTSPLSRSPGDSSPSSTTVREPRDILSGQQRDVGGRGQGWRSGEGRRRGSDSSSEGFRDVLGAEKWYIGGRTAAGEERYFKLGVVRRQRSGGDLSLDRLSL